MKAALVAAIIFDLAMPARSQDPKTVAGAARPASEVVTLAAGDPASKLAPRYSPPGRGLKLEPSRRPDLAGFDHLETRLKLGPNIESAAGHLLVLARGARASPTTCCSWTPTAPASSARRRSRSSRKSSAARSGPPSRRPCASITPGRCCRRGRRLSGELLGRRGPGGGRAGYHPRVAAGLPGRLDSTGWGSG